MVLIESAGACCFPKQLNSKKRGIKIMIGEVSGTEDGQNQRAKPKTAAEGE
jgi:hypothetical protein